MFTKVIVLKYIVAWIQCRSGATALDYGLIAGGISLAIFVATLAFGSSLRGIFTTLSTEFGIINTNS